MNNILGKIIVLILMIINLFIFLYFGFISIIASLQIAIYNYWTALNILILTTIASLGHVYIAWNLNKFTTSFQPEANK